MSTLRVVTVLLSTKQRTTCCGDKRSAIGVYIVLGGERVQEAYHWLVALVLLGSYVRHFAVIHHTSNSTRKTHNYIIFMQLKHNSECHRSHGILVEGECFDFNYFAIAGTLCHAQAYFGQRTSKQIHIRVSTTLFGGFWCDDFYITQTFGAEENILLEMNQKRC